MKSCGVLVACDTNILRRRGDDFSVGGDDMGGEGVCGEDMEECIIGEAEVWLPGIVGIEG